MVLWHCWCPGPPLDWQSRKGAWLASHPWHVPAKAPCHHPIWGWRFCPLDAACAVRRWQFSPGLLLARYILPSRSLYIPIPPFTRTWIIHWLSINSTNYNSNQCVCWEPPSSRVYPDLPDELKSNATSWGWWPYHPCYGRMYLRECLIFMVNEGKYNMSPMDVEIHQ